MFYPIKTLTIDENSPYMQEITQLAQANATTLGFLPKGAFNTLAADRQIIVAVDNNESFLGYLLYGTNQKSSLAYITHLCVNRLVRNRGVAKALFNELKNITKKRFRGIRVRCRREYDAATLWPKLGFYASGEIPGRSKQGSTLTVWWFDHGHPTLFSYVQNQESGPLKVVVDANVFYEIIVQPTAENQLSHSLLADWLDIELCLTNEIFTEINRKDDKALRKHARDIAHDQFAIVHGTNEEFERICKGLRSFFPTHMSESDESDLRQIARTIAGGIQLFITRDDALIKRCEDIYDQFGVRVISPSEMIIHRDAFMRETEYQPYRLAGSLLKIQRVNLQQTQLITDEFYLQSETKRTFQRKLSKYLIDPHVFETSVVKNDEHVSALIIFSRQQNSVLEVPIFRIVQGPLSSTLARHLVHYTVVTATKENRILTIVSDLFISEDIKRALHENAFVNVNNVWIKANIRQIVTITALAEKLNHLSGTFPNTSQYFEQLALTLNSPDIETPPQTLLQVERFLWPLKITDLELPAYIIPIWPEWAMHLFDQEMAKQTLFGADPKLMFNVENVYYRARRPMLKAPARILWYISQHNSDYQGTMSIRASSYLDEVIVDKPKALFSRFKRLGVYSWRDVYELAQHDVNRDIMAFRFSGTELFSDPISMSILQEIWQEERGKYFNIQGPLLISNALFLRLYQLGLNME